MAEAKREGRSHGRDGRRDSDIDDQSRTMLLEPDAEDAGAEGGSLEDLEQHDVVRPHC